MEIKPIRQEKRPIYPEKEAALQKPALLQSAPERWKRNASAYAALAATSAMLFSSCSVPVGKNGGAPAPSTVTVPFFEYGDGRGSFGCSSVAPPAFLSEPEALELINEVAAGAGLTFKNNGKVIEDVDLPVTSTLPEKYQSHDKYQKGSLQVDGYCEEKQIVFEFVSKEDIDGWMEKSNEWCSVSGYDFVGTAKALRQAVDRNDAGMPVAVFYDTADKEDLRAQIRDFIAWLKAEGIV